MVTAAVRARSVTQAAATHRAGATPASEALATTRSPRTPCATTTATASLSAEARLRSCACSAPPRAAALGRLRRAPRPPRTRAGPENAPTAVSRVAGSRRENSTGSGAWTMQGPARASPTRTAACAGSRRDRDGRRTRNPPPAPRPRSTGPTARAAPEIGRPAPARESQGHFRFSHTRRSGPSETSIKFSEGFCFLDLGLRDQNVGADHRPA